MLMQRHDFLSRLHDIVKPKVYLEIGVQHGTSLNLATGAEVAIGIDPYPQIQAQGNQTIFAMTADSYFAQESPPKVDLVFIDGSHLFEDALQDFRNIHPYCHAGTLIVFDDMLPYDNVIAGRIETPGHWTGDVWKVYEILSQVHPELQIRLVDTAPTGTMVVQNMSQVPLTQWSSYDGMVEQYLKIEVVPDHILNRTSAVAPEDILTLISATALSRQ